LMAFQSSGADLPMGVTAPIPVITTLLLFINFCHPGLYEPMEFMIFKE
jgi:hypothetical protein